jgi:hypothetical protein
LCESRALRNFHTTPVTWYEMGDFSYRLGTKNQRFG